MAFPQPGVFAVCLDCGYEFCAALVAFGSSFELDLLVNGVRENAIAISEHGAAVGCRTVRPNLGDYVRIGVHQQTGAPIAFRPNSNWNWNWLTVIRYF
jgi:hypothetical protein